ncbi:AAC(3) family N-acetyltransferase [Streptomyces sp. NPDC006923]|uniref:aminoglycoside N(3)-acetyltransferase n=1 Tax=Streptomyces sp. NPDC006923 TaxID=3155355 RepID=UPI0033C9EF25
MAENETGHSATSTDALARDLAALGVTPGTTLLVHASLSGTGLDTDDLRTALLTALGEDGTLVVPAFTEENSDTSSAHLARVRGMTRRQAAAFRARMPAFDAETTPCEGMGRLAESVRTHPGAVRSAHPQTSFAAVGRRAHELMAGHPLHSHLGEDSPLGALVRADARVLMVNVGFAACTAFHFAEYGRAAQPRSYRCVVKAPDGSPQWVEYEDVALDARDFEAIGAAFPWGVEQRGHLGGASVRLFPIKAAVAHAEAWMTEKRR